MYALCQLWFRLALLLFGGKSRKWLVFLYLVTLENEVNGKVTLVNGKGFLEFLLGFCMYEIFGFQFRCCVVNGAWEKFGIEIWRIFLIGGFRVWYSHYNGIEIWHRSLGLIHFQFGNRFLNFNLWFIFYWFCTRCTIMNENFDLYNYLEL